MSTQTPNLRLTQPSVDDDIGDTIPALAANMLAIDTAITNNGTGIASLQSQVTSVQSKQTADESNITALQQQMSSVQSKQATDETSISALQTQMAAVQSTNYTLPVATTTVLGGVKAGSNVTIAPDGTLSAQTSYALPSDVAKIDVAQTWTQDQTIGSTGTATANANAQSHSLKFNRNKWNGTSGVDATNILQVGSDGSLLFFNESGTEIFGLNQSGNGYFAGQLIVVGNASVNGSNVLTSLSSIAASQLPAATSTSLGGVKAGSGVSIAADGTISATGGGSGGSAAIATKTTPGSVIVSDPNMTVDVSGNLGLSSNVAKLGTGQTWTNMQTFGAGLNLPAGQQLTNNGTISGGTGNFSTLQVNGNNVLTSLPSDLAKTDVAQTWTATQTNGATNAATSSNNYGSNLFNMQRSSWNGSAAVTSTSSIGVDGAGTLDFVNESGVNAMTVSQTGDGFFKNSVHSPIVYSSGMTGATAASRYVGANNGAPTSGAFVVGDWIIDPTTPSVWICTAAGSPGTWSLVKPNTFFSNGLTSTGQISSSYGGSGFSSSSQTVGPRFATNASGGYFGIGPDTSGNVARIGNSNSSSWSAPSGTFVAKSDGAFQAAGLTGATAASRYAGATASGAPTTGTFAIGDFAIDQTGAFWVCTVAGTPGTWVKIGGNHFQSRVALFRGSYQVSSTSNTSVFAMSNGILPFTFHASEWSTTNFCFEGNVYTNNASYTAYAGIFDVTAGAAVSGSEISTTSTNGAVARSGSFTLTDGHVYTTYGRTSSASGSTSILASDLIALY